MSGNALGEYLRARRELVEPETVGLPGGGLRRVAGLRREEVAMLAGISADYYLRLEQGRDRNPSVQVLDALARVLQLDPPAVEYLVSLAAPRRGTRRRAKREIVPEGIRQLVATLPLPAFVEGRYLDILAANALATAVSPNIAIGNNRILSIFLDPADRLLYPDWDDVTAGLVATFREAMGADTDDPRFVQLVGELSVGSERFRKLWARHDIRSLEGRPMRLTHPHLGELTLRREKLVIPGADGMLLAIYHALPGTPDGDRLALLGSLLEDSAEVPTIDVAGAG